VLDSMSTREYYNYASKSHAYELENQKRFTLSKTNPESTR